MCVPFLSHWHDSFSTEWLDEESHQMFAIVVDLFKVDSVV